MKNHIYFNEIVTIRTICGINFVELSRYSVRLRLLPSSRVNCITYDAVLITPSYYFRSKSGDTRPNDFSVLKSYIER